MQVRGVSRDKRLRSPSGSMHIIISPELHFLAAPTAQSVVYGSRSFLLGHLRNGSGLGIVLCLLLWLYNMQHAPRCLAHRQAVCDISNSPFSHVYSTCGYKYCGCHQRSIVFFFSRGLKRQRDFHHFACGTDLALVYFKYCRSFFRELEQHVSYFVALFAYGTAHPGRLPHCRQFYPGPCTGYLFGQGRYLRPQCLWHSLHDGAGAPKW